VEAGVARRAAHAGDAPGEEPRSRLAEIRDVLRALRAGPVTPRQIAERAEISEPAAYRLIRELRAAGAPIEAGEVQGEAGRPTTTYRLTLDGLRQWIG
jgi:predicted ArsR family transcriptional regulator